jgi:hypothetical protein
MRSPGGLRHSGPRLLAQHTTNLHQFHVLFMFLFEPKPTTFCRLGTRTTLIKVNGVVGARRAVVCTLGQTVPRTRASISMGGAMVPACRL